MGEECFWNHGGHFVQSSCTGAFSPAITQAVRARVFLAWQGLLRQPQAQICDSFGSEGYSMRENTSSPQINLAKIPVGGGIAGAIFAVGSMMIFLTGIPALRYVFPASIVLGCAVALILHFIRHETPGTSRILSLTKK
jgi:hypothetical protein